MAERLESMDSAEGRKTCISLVLSAVSLMTIGCASSPQHFSPPAPTTPPNVQLLVKDDCAVVTVDEAQIFDPCVADVGSTSHLSFDRDYSIVLIYLTEGVPFSTADYEILATQGPFSLASLRTTTNLADIRIDVGLPSGRLVSCAVDVLHSILC